MTRSVVGYQDYLERRKELLRDFYRANFQTEPMSPDDLLAYYLELKKQVIDKSMPPVTNIQNARLEYFGFNFYSRYQRQGHTVVNEDIFEKIYAPIESCKLSSRGFFTSNCQVANFALLHVMNLVYPDAKFFYPTDRIYFESDYIVNRFQSLFTNPDPKQKIYYLDSSAILDESQLTCFADANDCPIIIFDTTCFDRQSSYIKTVVEAASKLNIPLILTRSHLKLDSFGTEYDSLGSMVFLNFEDKDIYTRCYEFISHMGAFALFNQIYPFLSDQKLKDLNSLRVSAIQENSKYIYSKLNKVEGDFGFYQPERLHGLSHVFVYQREKVDFIRAGERFLALCKVYDIAGEFCDSFGFDFFSLTNVESYDQHNRGFLRFCSPLDSALNDKAVDVINNLVKHIALK